MSKTNCVNCGAAIEYNISKCPFCGTSYFDFTNIDFTSQEPIALRLKSQCQGHDAIVTCLAKPRLDSTSCSVDTEYIHAYANNNIPIATFTASTTAKISVGFDVIPQNKTIFNIFVEN